MDEENKTPEVMLEQTPATAIVKQAETSLEKARAMNEQTETNQILLLAELVGRVEELIDRMEIAVEVLEQRATNLEEATAEVTEIVDSMTEETSTEAKPEISTEVTATVGKKKAGLKGFLI